ncbi:MAG: ROK family protein [Renibacterium salmoninarum]|nr:ROK family protein [Renibacterium salmoninarum]
MSTLAIDVGGSSFKIALVDRGVILEQEKLRHTSQPSDLDRLIRLCRRIVGQRPMAAVGLSLPGVIDQAAGAMVSAHAKCGYMLGMDLRGWAEAAFGVPALIENDARCALWGEVGYGAARGMQNVVLLSFGTGIGTAVLLDRKALSGPHGHGGILGGHQSVEVNGRLCTCGNRGCVEAEASGWSIPLIAEEWPGIRDSALADVPHKDFAAVAHAAETGDSIAQEIVARVADCWGSAITNLCHHYDPEAVVLTGGLMSSAHLVIDRIRDDVDRRIWAIWGRPEITVAADVYASATLGLDYLARKHFGAASR